MDTDALVKLTKGSAKDVVASAFELIVPPEVQKESVDQGKAAARPDAVRIEANLRNGGLTLVRTRRSGAMEGVIKTLRLSGGEADVLRLYASGRADAVVSDDSRFLRFLADLEIPFATPSSLLVVLVRTGKLKKREGLGHLEKMSGMISEAEYLEARRALEA